MAAAASSPSHAPRSESREWITPQEQLIRLASPFVEEQLKREPNKEILAAILPGLHKPIVESCTRSLVNRFISIDTDPAANQKVSSLFDLYVQRLSFKIDPLPKMLTDWYTALQRRRDLPDKVPALPQNMFELLGTKCPNLMVTETGHKETTYGDTWSLFLLTGKTLLQLESSARAYGERTLNGEAKKRVHPDPNPFKFNYFWESVRKAFGDAKPCGEPYWILHMNEPWPDSETVFRFSKRSIIGSINSSNYPLGPCRSPSLLESATAYFDGVIARGWNGYRGPRWETEETVQAMPVTVLPSCDGLGIDFMLEDLDESPCAFSLVVRF